MPGYLIEYNRRSRSLNVTKFDSLLEATLKRLELDRTNDNPDLEIVAIASESEDHLRQSHSRYFSAV